MKKLPEEIKAEIMMPIAFVTTRSQTQATRYPFGITDGESQDQITVDYEITIVASSKFRTAKSQTLLYSAKICPKSPFSVTSRFPSASLSSSKIIPSGWLCFVIKASLPIPVISNCICNN